MGNATTLFVDPLTFDQMFMREGLPNSSHFLLDDFHWTLRIKTTDLPEVDGANLYPATLVNNGDEVRVVVNKVDLGPIQLKSLPQAVEALRAYGGKKAPAYVKGTGGKEQADSIYVIKPKKMRKFAN